MSSSITISITEYQERSENGECALADPLDPRTNTYQVWDSETLFTVRGYSASVELTPAA